MEGIKNRKIGVLMGGMSREREISLRSGRAVLSALLELGYDAVGVDVGSNVAEEIKKTGMEVAFIALHGRYGEDGCIQGILEMMGIPYTGSGVTASAIAMDKRVTKMVLNACGIPTPRYMVIDERVEDIDMSPPLVVKPVDQGSTIGVSLIRRTEDLERAVKEARRYSGRVLVESYIEGRELTVSILNGRILPVVEIKPSGEIYDYTAKYTKGMTEFDVPAVLEGGIEDRVKEIALSAYRAIGCRGGVRVDMVLGKDGIPYVLEVNTVPGMTERSLFPMAASGAGMGYRELVEEILLDAGVNKS